MDRRFHLIALIFFLGGAVYLWSSRDQGSNAPATSSNTQTETERPETLSKEEIQRQFDVLARETEAKLAELNSQETETQKRDDGVAKMAKAREQQQLAKQSFWAQILSTNWPAYEKLRARAYAFPQETIPCTICDGRGKLDSCILCEGSGKCATCGGTGHLQSGDLCPNCLGTGKCYLCGGSGKMVCPFCDDGVVYAKSPPPPNLLPIYCQAPGPAVATLGDGPNKNTDTSRLSPEQLSRMSGTVNRRAIAPPPPPISYNSLLLVIAIFLAFGLSLQKTAQWLERRFNFSLPDNNLLRKKLIAEEPSLVAFFNELRYGLGTSTDNAAAGAHLSPGETETQTSQEEGMKRLQEFFDSAPDCLAAIRAQFSLVSRTHERAARVELLREFFSKIDVLKEKSAVPGLRPVWLMTCGLEGLIQQLSMTTTPINPSILRTISGAVKVLEALCVPGVDPDLAKRTPVELLAVDDNAVCLTALSLALKKAFRQPDLAAEGVAALDMARQKKYDAIFLDIEMPGMDGFELCSEIRKTHFNRNTPIVFVTSHSDFDSRAKATLVGGHDLIAKPYLSFEITVKALTLALRGRLATDTAASDSTAKEISDEAVLAPSAIVPSAQSA